MNYDLFLTSLVNLRGSNVTELDGIRSQIISATMSSKPITFNVLKLQDVEGPEEFTYALWENGNLIKKHCQFLLLKMNFRFRP